jgi:major membrane immunogen (membrane-anchored lipoprotein)
MRPNRKLIYAFDIFTFVKDLVDIVLRDGRISTVETRYKNRTGKKVWRPLNEQT